MAFSNGVGTNYSNFSDVYQGIGSSSSVAQKISQLKEEIRQVKSNDKLSEEQKQRKIRNLKRQIQQLERQKEKESQKKVEEQKQADDLQQEKELESLEKSSMLKKQTIIEKQNQQIQEDVQVIAAQEDKYDVGKPWLKQTNSNAVQTVADNAQPATEINGSGTIQTQATKPLEDSFLQKPAGQKELLWNKDFFRAEMDCKQVAEGTNQIQERVDYLASRYAVMKNSIEETFTGQDKQDWIARLGQEMENNVEHLTKKFSQEVGTVFEQNGVEGESDKLYQSMKDAFTRRVEHYTDFANSNEEYLNIEDKPWLAKDSEYLASQLRKEATAQPAKPQQQKEYTLQEMEKMYHFAKEFTKYQKIDTMATTNTIAAPTLQNEETLGLKLAELTLKGKVFNEYAGVSQKVQQAVTTAIQNFAEKSINEMQLSKNPKKWDTTKSTEQQQPQEQASIEERKQPVEDTPSTSKNMVYDIIHHAEKVYDRTQNVSKALIETAVMAKDAFAEKSSDREDTNAISNKNTENHWNTFLESQKNPLKQNPYLQTESAMQTMAATWNTFMAQITGNPNAFLTPSVFSAKI